MQQDRFYAEKYGMLPNFGKHEVKPKWSNISQKNAKIRPRDKISNAAWFHFCSWKKMSWMQLIIMIEKTFNCSFRAVFECSLIIICYYMYTNFQGRGGICKYRMEEILMFRFRCPARS